MKFLEKKWKGKHYKLYAIKDKNSVWLHFQGRTWVWKNKKYSQKSLKEGKKEKLIISDLPGKIQKILVKKGDKVKKGQSLLTLLSMKIEYNFKAEGSGKIEEIFCKEGQTVNENKKLIKINYS